MENTRLVGLGLTPVATRKMPSVASVLVFQASPVPGVAGMMVEKLPLYDPALKSGMASPLARAPPTLLTTSVPATATEVRPVTLLLAMPTVLLTTTLFVLPEESVTAPLSANGLVSAPPRPGARVALLPKATVLPTT